MTKIKVLKAAAYYPDFLKNTYDAKVYNQDLSYAANHISLMDCCFSWSDFWKTNLETLGDFEAQEIVYNAENLQKKWAHENNFKYDNDNWQQSIFTEQIKIFSPDVLVMQDLYHHSHYIKNLKKIVPSLKIIIGWDGILYHRKEIFADCDVIFSCVQDTCDFYGALGFKTHYFKFGFEQSILAKLKNNEAKHPVSFVGSLYLGEGYHQNRLRLISGILSKVEMDIWAASFDYEWKWFSKSQIKRIIDFRFSLANDIHKVAGRNKGPVFGLDMFQVLYDSKITFNSHGDNSPKKAANMRLIEATGVGTCLLTDWKENLNDFFVPDKEVVTYKNSKEAIDKILYLIDHEEERKKIAKAGQERTFKEYSYKVRMAEVAGYIRSLL